MQIRELMKMVGRKRFVVLVTLLIVCGVLGGAWQKFFIPQFDNLTTAKDKAQRDTFRLRQDINELPTKYKLLQENEVRYEELMAQGFNKPQDRIEARRNMDALRLKTGIRGVNYDIAPQKDEINAQNIPADSSLVVSDIKLTFKGLSDVEMRDFIEDIRKDFSGLMIMDKMTLENKIPVTQDNLAQLNAGKPTDFVEGEASFHWYNLIPKGFDPNTPPPVGGSAK